MAAIKYLFFFALALACVFATETDRVKKDVVYGGYPYGYSGLYSGAYVPTAYSGYYPTAYSAGAYPYGYRSIVY